MSFLTTRLLATLFLTVPVMFFKPVPMPPFAAFLVVHYVAQLVLEVFVSLRELGQNHDPRRPPTKRPEETLGLDRDTPREARDEDATE